MKAKSYSTLANRFTSRFPLFSYLGTQINFWVIVNLLLAVILHLHSRIQSFSSDDDVVIHFKPVLFVALVFGIVYGIVLGLIGYLLELRKLNRWPIGMIILIKTVVSIILLYSVLWLIRFTLPSITYADVSEDIKQLSIQAWKYIFYLLLIYYFFMAILISFINQVNKKYGPGVLIPLLLGKYRSPQEEERIFLFMDLKSSTSTAENLGHFQYSAFIRDCFEDINEQLFQFRAQVYQYVGDEIVVMWPLQEGINEQACVNFFFACKAKFNERSKYYLDRYGVLPEFKAGLHCGVVTAVEIGQIKKDIAYHGDTINTAARIQGVCNQYQKDFLASEHMINQISSRHSFKIITLDEVLLRGKTDKIAIVSLENH